jgi:hypothetical protein
VKIIASKTIKDGKISKKEIKKRNEYSKIFIKRINKAVLNYI